MTWLYQGRPLRKRYRPWPDCYGYWSCGMTRACHRKHVWRKVARRLQRQCDVPYDLAVRVVKANRAWLKSARPSGLAYKLWDMLLDRESAGGWPYERDDMPDYARTFLERYPP